MLYKLENFVKSLEVLEKYKLDESLKPLDDYYQAKKTLEEYIDLGIIKVRENTFDDIEARLD